MVDIEELERLDKAATPGPVRQGELLPTRETQRWPSHEREALHRAERREAFVGFSDRDAGRSRRRIAQFDRPEDAAFFSAARNALPDLLAELRTLRAALAERDAGLARARAAITELLAVRAERERMRRDHPAGTCDAEDAWRDFGRREAANDAALAAALAPSPAEGAGDAVPLDALFPRPWRTDEHGWLIEAANGAMILTIDCGPTAIEEAALARLIVRAVNASHRPATAGDKSDGWVPVGERLPEEGVEVLAANGGQSMVVGCRLRGFWDDDVPFPVTHWRPLPPAPR